MLWDKDVTTWTRIYGANVGKEVADCFYLDFGDAGGSVVISGRTLTSFNYSSDKQQWNTVAPGGVVNVNSGKVYLRAATPVTSLFSSGSSYNAWTISGTGVKAGGNINTLLNADDPDGVVYSPCTFASMFHGCTSLTQAPELPATTLAYYCYGDMFRLCTSLTEAPVLPATTLARYCYKSMFQNCTKLEYIKCLATDISDSGCTYAWVSGVAKSGTFVKNNSTTSWPSGSSGIPDGWTVIGI